MSETSQHNCEFGGYLMDLNDQINDLESFRMKAGASLSLWQLWSFYSCWNEPSQHSTSKLPVVFDLCWSLYYNCDQKAEKKQYERSK